jgi:hypothetical protein
VVFQAAGTLDGDRNKNSPNWRCSADSGADLFEVLERGRWYPGPRQISRMI